MDIAGNNRDEQIAATQEAAFASQINDRIKELHTTLPGLIAVFDPVKQTAQVQPAIKRIFTEAGPVALPLCVDVPVAFPGGGDFFLTFPVKAGDECILHFSERCIDFWYINGGVQLPAEYRLHDLSDAFAVVGVNSQPRKIPNFNVHDVELRDRTRTSRITMKPDGTIENVNAEGSTILSAAGKFTINAPGGFELNAPTAQHNVNASNMTGTLLVQKTITGQAGIAISGSVAGGGGAAATITGNIAQTGNFTASGTITGQTDVIAGGKSGKTHTHSGVQPGSGNSGGPT